MRHVTPVTFQQAASNLAKRHKKVTGMDQNIYIKTLDDYHDKIKWGTNPEHPFDFEKNKYNPVRDLRQHCTDIRDIGETQHTKKVLKLHELKQMFKD